jgi:thiosulfate/3-mercaptopyruvate sulfurtransferase
MTVTTAQSAGSGAGYAHPETLVSTQWVQDHLNDTSLRIVEADEDVLLYDIGHVPGAVKVDWHTDLQDPLTRDFVDEQGFAKLMSRLGIANDTTVIFYGDKNNWWAAYAFWYFRYNGHKNLKIMNGGRKKWEDEGRTLTKDAPSITPTNYKAGKRDESIRAFRDDVLEHAGFKGRQKVSEGKPLVDVRSPAEYSGEKLHMPEYPQEGALRGGHIPGAASIPWAQAVAEDGTFKSADQLKELYGGKGITGDKEIIAYCRIGERSSHTWFVLHELLGYPNVRNYDGSWTEWGNVIGVPIER